MKLMEVHRISNWAISSHKRWCCSCSMPRHCSDHSYSKRSEPIPLKKAVPKNAKLCRNNCTHFAHACSNVSKFSSYQNWSCTRGLERQEEFRDKPTSVGLEKQSKFQKYLFLFHWIHLSLCESQTMKNSSRERESFVCRQERSSDMEQWLKLYESRLYIVNSVWFYM